MIPRVSRLAALAALASFAHTAKAQITNADYLVVPTDDDYQDCGDWCAVSIIFIILFGSVLLCLCLAGCCYLCQKRTAKSGRQFGHGLRRSRSPVVARTPVMRSPSPGPIIVPAGPVMAPQPMMATMAPQQMMMAMPQMTVAAEPILYDAFGQQLMRPMM